MYRLNTTILTLQRALFSRGCYRSCRQILRSEIHHQNIRKRRLSSNDQVPGFISAESLVHENEVEKLERYTISALRSQLVPLGTLTPTDWEKMLDALEAWTSTQLSTSGYAIVSAERLLERLHYELLASSPINPLYAKRTIQLEEMRMTILQSWLRIHRKHPASMMVLERSEATLLNLLKSSSLVPGAELLEVLDGWLIQHSPNGSKRAALLLLESTTQRYQQDLTSYASQLGPRFDRTILSVLQKVERDKAIDLNAELLERIEHLKSHNSWNDMVIAESTLTAIDELVFQHYLDNGPAVSNPSPASTTPFKATISTFEAEAMQQRMIALLQNSGSDNQEDVAKLMPRLNAVENPSDALMNALVDFHLRVGDVANASVWILRLAPSQILGFGPTGGGLTILDRLLDIWLHQSHPRAPWRAEEVFRQILDRMEKEGLVLSTPTMNRMLRIWSQSSDPSAPRKVREWFSRMTEFMNLKPDESSLFYALTAMDKNTTLSDELYENVLDVWGRWNLQEKQQIADLLMDLLWKTTCLPKVTLDILARIKAEDILTARERFLPLLHRAFADLDPYAIPDRIEDLTKKSGVDLTLYEAGIYILTKESVEHLVTATSVWRSALEAVANSDKVDSGDLAVFVTNVVTIYTRSDRPLYGHGETFLLAAEECFLPMSGAASTCRTSLIPLEAYKQLVIRNWYRADSASKVLTIFERVKSLYGQGFVNLRPDRDFFWAYLKATSIVSEEPNELVGILNDMVQIHENSTDDTSCKPNADFFNVIFLSIKSNAKNPKEAWQQSFSLWKRMKSMDVAPDRKTLNLLIISAVKGERPGLAYTIALDLHREFERWKLEPDSHTFHAMISACGNAKDGDHENALNLCLQMFGEIRKRGETTVFTYASLTKSLRRLLRKGPLAEKVVTSTIHLCYQDGLLAPEVRQAYQSMVTDRVWNEIYGKKLTKDNDEPDDWHRHLPNAS